MFARSSTVQGRPRALDAGIAMVREEVLPAVMALDGCTGVSLLVDRTGGGMVVTTGWTDRDTMRASALRVAPLHDRAQAVLGDRAQVREWEVGALHRVEPVRDGACARVTWTQVDPHRLEDALYVFRVGTLPQIADLPGFCSASLFVDRTSGVTALSVVYASPATMAQARDPGAVLREETTDHLGLGTRLLDVAEFEVVLARLRLPETV